MLNLGVRAHDFGKLPVAELAARIAQHGLSCVQLAPVKAIADVEPDRPLTADFARQVAAVFQQHGIRIAVLSCYINLAEPNAAIRRQLLTRFKEHLQFARAFGCRFVATETGSLNSDFSPHPENTSEAAFCSVLAAVRELVAAAAQEDAVVAVEAVERYVISSPQRLCRLVDEIDSPHVQVILDPVNLLSTSNHLSQRQLVAEAIDRLGSRCAVVHAKDFAIVDGRFEERDAGRGQFDYRALLRWIKTEKPGLPVILENTHPATIAETIAFIRAAYDQA
jgi:L-ribulose-5-phosphate 3-epimerase